MCFDHVASATEQVALGHFQGQLFVEIIPRFIRQATHVDSFFFFVAVVQVEQKFVSFYTLPSTFQTATVLAFLFVDSRSFFNLIFYGLVPSFFLRFDFVVENAQRLAFLCFLFIASTPPFFLQAHHG